MSLLSHGGAAQTPAVDTLTFPSVADVYVDSGLPTTNLNPDPRLRARGPAARISYLRFAVTGVGGRPVRTARLRLEVAGAASIGGAIHRISDVSWNEAAVTYATRPVVDGPIVTTLGAVALGTVVEFNLDTTVTGDGVYAFAIDSPSTDGVTYNSAAATTGQKPALVLTVATTPPAVTIIQPPDGTGFFVGDPITLQATAGDGAGGDLGAAVTWTSSLAGPLGNGPLLTTPLPQGSHTITAAVTDGFGHDASSTIHLTVAARPAVNTDPLVAITAPASGALLAAGPPVAFRGTANDLEDGNLSASLGWTSDRDGPLGTGATITRPLSQATHRITADVRDAGGLRGAAIVTVNVQPPASFSFPAIADASVDAGLPAVNFGASPVLRVDANTARVTYLRFAVAGIGDRPVGRALLRLTVDGTLGAESDSGGAVHSITGGAWTEDALTWATRPPVDGPALATAGPVALGEVIELDVSAAVRAAGTYDFALVNASSDEATYRSREGGSAPTLVVTVPDNAPVVSIGAPDDGLTAFQGAPVTFAGQATDAEDGDLTARLAWTSDRDGPLGSGPLVVSSTLAPGTHTITAAAADSDGLRGEAQRTVRVRTPNLPPSVTITAPVTGSAVVAGTSVTLVATATDDFDGDLAAAVGWRSSRSGDLGTGARLATGGLAVGTHTLRATVTDSDGATATAEVSLTVTPTPPVVTITAPAAGTTVFAGAPLTLSANAADVLDGDLSASLRWTSDLDGPLGTGAQVVTSALAIGRHTVTAAVTNTSGLEGVAARVVEVRRANAAPTVAVVAPADGTALLAGRPVLVGAVATDAEDGDLGPEIRWTSSREGVVATGATRVLPGLSAGTHVLTAAVTDRDGASAAASVTVTVASPTRTFAPAADTYVDSGSASAKFGTATSLLAGTSPTRQAFLRFPVSGLGPFAVQQALVRLNVGSGSSDASTAGGTLRSITNTTWSEATTTYGTRPAVDGAVLSAARAVAARQVVDFDATAAVRGDGSYDFALVSTASDWVRYLSREAGAGGPQLVVTLTQDTAPLVAIDAPAPATRIVPGAAVVLTGRATDAETGDLGDQLAWRSDRDGLLGTGRSLTVATLRPGTHTITAEVTDAGGHRGQAQVAVAVDHPPAVTIAAPADGSVVFVAGPPVVLVGQASDVEDGDLGAGLSWRSDRDGALGTGTLVTVPALGTGSHTITAGVADRDGVRTEARITLRVRDPNAAPVVAIVAPADGGAIPAGTAVALAAVVADDFDLDLGAALRWTSSRDGALGTGTTRTVILSEGSHTLTAAVTDSDGATGSAQIHLVVTPTAPAVTIATPVPGSFAFVGTTVTFSGTALDATDGALSASLRWTSDRDGPIGTGASVVTDRLRVGTHTVTASVTDAGGLVGGAQRTLVVRPPNVPPAIAVAAPLEGARLLAGKPILLGARVTDVEDGLPDLGVRWTSSRDGVLGTGATLVVPALSVGTHTLTATATDRDTASTSASVTVTVVSPALAFVPVADTYVDANSPSSRFGTATGLVASSSPVRQALLRFTASGVAPFAVERAVLRFTVGTNSGDGSPAGGTVRTLTDTTWSEATTTYKTRPAVDGPALATTAKVVAKQAVDFDVTPAVRADGTVNFALVGGATDSVKYASREASSGKPQLLLTLAQDTPPVVVITAPRSGDVVDLGVPVVFAATARDAESGDLGVRITWGSDRAGLLGSGVTLAVATLGLGLHRITAQVVDGAQTAQAEILLTVASPPVVTITAPASGALVVPGEAVALSATAADAQDGDVTPSLVWTSSLDGALGTGGAVTTAALRPGTHAITATATNARGRPGSARATVVVDAPPSVAIAAPLDGATFVPGDTVRLAGTATDPEEGDLGTTIIWTSSLDGPLGAGAVLDVRTLRAGAHRLTASVIDREGRRASATVAIVVDTPPAITILAPADGTFVPRGSAVTLGATATDAEDGSLTAAVAWSSDLDGPLGAGGTLAARPLRAGTHTITAMVTDALGRSATARTTIVVDTLPLVTIAAPDDGATVEPGTGVALVAQASDAEDGDLTPALAWVSSLDGPLGTGGTLTVGTLRSGIHTLTASVADGAGRIGSAQIVLMVDALPTLTIAAPADGVTVEPGTPLALTATASDREDGPLDAMIAWTSSLEGSLGTGGALTVGSLRSGTHVITASIRDTSGRRVSQSRSVVVNALPTLAITAPAGGALFRPGEPVLFRAGASDLEDGDLSAAIDWTSDLDGGLGTGGTLAVGTLRSGTHTITASVADHGGRAASARVSVVVNAPPAIALVAPADGTSFLPGTSIAFTATAADVEDGPLNDAIVWTSDLDGPLGTGGTVAVATLRPGTHVVTASVSDAGGRTASARLSVLVNTPPTITIEAPADGAAYVPGAAVSLTATAGDLEDGPLDAAVAWTSDLDGPLGGGRTLTLTTLRSGTHLITASVTDRGGRMASAQRAVVVNAPPTIAVTAPAEGAIFAPGAPTPLAATATDLEDGPLTATIAWTSDLDGPLGTGGTLTVATLRSGTHTLTASVVDAGGLTAVALRSVVVNAPPVVTLVAPAAGASFLPGAAIFLAATATDLEDGPLGGTIAWTSDLDGPLGTGGALEIATLRAGTHTVTASVTDSGGRTGSGAIAVVVNTPPTITLTAPVAGAVVFPTDTVPLRAVATDPEDADPNAAVTWTSSLDGPLGTGASLDVTLRSGTHVLSARILDSAGAAASAETVVVADGPPAVAIATPAGGATFAPGIPVYLTGIAHDGEDGDLGAAITWTSSLDGPLGTSGSLVVGTLRSGLHTITASVTDSRGRPASAAIDLRVNATPTLAITAPTDTAVVVPGTPVSLAATAADLEDGPLGAAVVWTSELDGVLGTGSALVVSTLRSGRHTVTASVTDSAGATATAEVVVRVNAPPALAITAPADGTAFAPATPLLVTMAGTATDLEDGDLGGALRWTSSLDGSLGTGRTLTVGSLRTGVHTLTATVSDGAGAERNAAITIVVAPLITLQGTYTTPYSNTSLLPRTRIDARAATFLAGPGNLYSFNLEGGAGVDVQGGTVHGQYDRTWSWDQMHLLNNAGLAFDNAGVTVDGLRADNVTDGVRPRKGGTFTIRNIWLSYARDDCIENDHVHDGLLDDALLDGCYSGFSARPSPAIIDSGFNGHDKLWTIQNTLVRLQPLPGPREPSADNLGHGGFFKWHSWDDPAASLSPNLALHNNVFMAERVGEAGASRMGIPPGRLASCSDNVMVWLGPGGYPAPLPSCFTITTDRAVWDAAVAAWHERHPDVGP